MKNKIYLSAIIIFLIFCFVIFYNGLNSSNVYTPKINQKQNLPKFEAKDFYSGKNITSEETYKIRLEILRKEIDLPVQFSGDFDIDTFT